MRRHANAIVLFDTQRDVSVNRIVSEHAACGQELAVCVQRLQGFFQRAGNLRDLFRFFRRQVIQVFVHRFARVDLVLDAVETGHQQGSEAQVRVSRRVREAHFDTTRFRRRNHRDTDRRRAVTRRVSQHHRRFVARNQTLVRVGGRVRQGVNGFRVFDYAADVVQRLLRQTRVFIAREQVGAVLGQGHVAVHTGAVIAEHRFRHEGCGFAEAVRDVMHDIFVDLNFVRFLGHGVEAGRHFVLTGGGHFVVVRFNDQAHLFHGQTHHRTDVLRRVNRRNREITAFHARTVAFVAAFVFGGGVPRAFDVVNRDMGAGDGAAEADVVKQEELRFRPEQYGVRDAGGAQVFFCALGDGARVAIVALHGARLEDVATNNQGRFFVERVNDSGGGVRHQHHVRFIDAFPATDGRAIEHFTFFEEVGVHLVGWDGDVLFFTFSISEAQIHKLHFMFIQHRQNVFSGHT
ncbi:Glutamine synthetase (glnA) gene and ORF1 [Cronobacter universalis NCTC 9529]|nr:Glutamine synthetase (glnA) gene and ORF1 [Cronobacter universalis NCTC 9529]